MELQTLSIENVLQIHEILVGDFAETPDPIEPPGVKSVALLESAVSRQHTSLGGRLKYADAVSNASTLAYGLCNDHPFHNGNKRTALVTFLVHLDRNKLTLRDTRDKDVFDLMIAIANHAVASGVTPTRKYSPDRARRSKPDEEVAAIAKWIDKRVDRISRAERQITFRDLRRILGRHNYHLDDPKGNRIQIIKLETVTQGLFRKRTVTKQTHIGAIGYPGDNQFVALNTIKYVRKLCKLTEEDGCDSTQFYDEVAVVDSFINKYRTVLRRLANR